jgi:hypothetical protein
MAEFPSTGVPHVSALRWWTKRALAASSFFIQQNKSTGAWPPLWSYCLPEGRHVEDPAPYPNAVIPDAVQLSEWNYKTTHFYLCFIMKNWVLVKWGLWCTWFYEPAVFRVLKTLILWYYDIKQFGVKLVE